MLLAVKRHESYSVVHESRCFLSFVLFFVTDTKIADAATQMHSVLGHTLATIVEWRTVKMNLMNGKNVTHGAK